MRSCLRARPPRCRVGNTIPHRSWGMPSVSASDSPSSGTRPSEITSTRPRTRSRAPRRTRSGIAPCHPTPAERPMRREPDAAAMEAPEIGGADVLVQCLPGDVATRDEGDVGTLAREDLGAIEGATSPPQSAITTRPGQRAPASTSHAVSISTACTSAAPTYGRAPSRRRRSRRPCPERWRRRPVHRADLDVRVIEHSGKLRSIVDASSACPGAIPAKATWPPSRFEAS